MEKRRINPLQEFLPIRIILNAFARVALWSTTEHRNAFVQQRRLRREQRSADRDVTQYWLERWAEQVAKQEGRKPDSDDYFI